MAWTNSALARSSASRSGVFTPPRLYRTATSKGLLATRRAAPGQPRPLTLLGSDDLQRQIPQAQRPSLGPCSAPRGIGVVRLRHRGAVGRHGLPPRTARAPVPPVQHHAGRGGAVHHVRTGCRAVYTAVNRGFPHARTPGTPQTLTTSASIGNAHRARSQHRADIAAVTVAPRNPRTRTEETK